MRARWLAFAALLLALSSVSADATGAGVFGPRRLFFLKSKIVAQGGTSYTGHMLATNGVDSVLATNGVDNICLTGGTAGSC